MPYAPSYNFSCGVRISKKVHLFHSPHIRTLRYSHDPLLRYTDPHGRRRNSQALANLEKLQASEADLKAKQETCQTELADTAKSLQRMLSGIIDIGSPAKKAKGGSGRFSEETKQKMREAQQRRWAAVKKGK